MMHKGERGRESERDGGRKKERVRGPDSRSVQHCVTTAVCVCVAEGSYRLTLSICAASYQQRDSKVSARVHRKVRERGTTLDIYIYV